MSNYPVQITVMPPAHFDRIQLLLRLVIAVVLAWIGTTAGWLVCALYLALPVLAAVAISSLGSASYLASFAPRLWRVLAWLLQFSAFMALVTDRFPTGDGGDIQINIRFTGRPTIGSSLARFLMSIPSGFVLGLLWIVSGVLWLIGAVIVLIGEPMPRSIFAFQCGVVRWQARLVAYHASLVEEYPPFSFESERGGDRSEPLHAAPR